MKVGILGLGLIGGSLARAYSLAGHTVYAIQRNESMLSFAMLAGAVHGKLNEETIPQCDLILLAIYPDGCASWLEENAPLISKNALVIDCCGIKEKICSRGFPPGEGIRLHLHRRPSHGRLPVLRLQVQPLGPVPGRAHGAGTPCV